MQQKLEKDAPESKNKSGEEAQSVLNEITASPQADEVEEESPVSKIDSAMDNFDRNMSIKEQLTPITFDAFLEEATAQPAPLIRNVFQYFHDMVKLYVGEGIDEYPDDPESIAYICYDCSQLFVQDTDHPFFADRLFANRLIKLVEAMKRGAQQNKIYIFKGPHGCGKSTFLNNLLKKFEEYTPNRVCATKPSGVWIVNCSVMLPTANPYRFWKIICKSRNT